MAALIKVMSHNEVVYLLFKVCLPWLGRKPRIFKFIFIHFAAELQLLPSGLFTFQRGDKIYIKLQS
jgi:hypothetical protein